MIASKSIDPVLTRVACYVRVSTDKQQTDSQEVELKRWCTERGWLVTRWFRDVESGAKTDRKGLEGLMECVRCRELDVVMAVRVDRLARSTTHFLSMVEEMKRNKCALVLTAQAIDTSKFNPCGEMMMGMLAVIAQFERTLICGRVRDGMAAAKARGVKLGHASKKLKANHEQTIAEWRDLRPREGYRKLAKMLGGVSVATAHYYATKEK